MRSDAGVGGDAVAAGPAIAGEVRVLQTPLQPTLFALIDLVPEAEGCLIDVHCVTRASTARSWCAGSSGGNFNSAAAVVGIGGAVTAHVVHRGGNRRGRQGRVGRLNRRSCGGARLLADGAASRNGRSIDDFYLGVSRVSCAAVILAAEVTVKVPLGRRVNFDPGEILCVPEQRESAIGTSCHVRELRGTISAGAAAANEFKADVEFFGKETLRSADTKTTARRRIIVGTDSGGCSDAARTAEDGWRCRGGKILRRISDHRARIDA